VYILIVNHSHTQANEQRANKVSKAIIDGDQVQNKSIAAQVPSKELDVMMAAHEQPTTSRIWPIFVTLVSQPPGGLGPISLAYL